MFADLVSSTSLFESLGDATASHFVTQLTAQLSCASSYGTWVYLDNESRPMVLRRGECQLIGAEHIRIGGECGADAAPVVRLELSSDN